MSDLDAPRVPVVSGAPDEIWLVYGELEHDTTHAVEYRDGEVTWCQHKQYGSDVRYVRADACERLQAEAAARGEHG